MESIDMKKLENAIAYLQRIAEGNNPINNLPADEDSVPNGECAEQIGEKRIDEYDI